MNLPFGAVLLAGGQSSRMGCDKGVLEFDGEPLWQRQLRLLESLSPQQIFFAGPAHLARGFPHCQVIADAQPASGPLAGLVAALRVCVPPLLLALAVDLPRMTADCLRALLERCECDQGVVPVTDQVEPLAAVYPITALPLAEEQLVRGQYSMQQFVGRCLDEGLMLPRPVSATDAACFLNLNTPADLQRALDEP